MYIELDKVYQSSVSFVGTEEPDCFLETTTGQTYLSAFSHIRWQHIVIDLDSLLILEQDRIVNLGQ